MSNPLIEKYYEVKEQQKIIVPRFKHIDIELPKLERETIDGVRYYSIPDDEEILKLVSITSVTSYFNREIFINWRKKIGEEEAQKITKAATSRGTDMHSLVENYLYNKTLPSVPPCRIFFLRLRKRNSIV